MNITYKIDKIKKNNWLNIAFDIGKEDLHFYSEMGNGTITCIADSFANNTDIILRKLEDLYQTAKRSGYKGIHIICEPSGGYENKLMCLALQQGHATSYVSGEASSKFRIVEGNNNNKSDKRDPRVIFKLAQYGRLLKHRVLSDTYQQLRHLNRMHEQEQELRNYSRNQLHQELKVLFCERDWKEAFWYGVSGRAVLKLYHGNPYKIIKAGRSRFAERMKKAVKGIRNSTIERIWTNAEQSVKLNYSESLSDLISERIEDLWADFQLHERRLKEIKEHMAGLYRELLDQGEQLPPVVKGFVSIENLARIAGETGPFSDFKSSEQIKQYAGMNICVRESGKFTGRCKLSKKGRPRLRLILNQSIFHLIKKDRILGEYYHGLKDRGMNGTKAMSVVSRKLLDILFALSRPGVIFDQQRMFTCKSKYRKAA